MHIILTSGEVLENITKVRFENDESDFIVLENSIGERWRHDTSLIDCILPDPF